MFSFINNFIEILINPNKISSYDLSNNNTNNVDNSVNNKNDNIISNILNNINPSDLACAPKPIDINGNMIQKYKR